MSGKADPPGPNLDAAIRLQEQYNTYFLTLTFTLLGLAVQSAEFGRHRGPIIVELSAWAMLFISGISGLRRGRRTPQFYRIANALTHNLTIEESVKSAHQAGYPLIAARDTGRVVSVETALVESTRGVEGMRKLLDAESGALRCLSLSQRIGFGVGVGALLLARGWAALAAGT